MLNWKAIEWEKAKVADQGDGGWMVDDPFMQNNVEIMWSTYRFRYV